MLSSWRVNSSAGQFQLNIKHSDKMHIRSERFHYDTLFRSLLSEKISQLKYGLAYIQISKYKFIEVIVMSFQKMTSIRTQKIVYLQ